MINTNFVNPLLCQESNKTKLASFQTLSVRESVVFLWKGSFDSTFVNVINECLLHPRITIMNLVLCKPKPTKIQSSISYITQELHKMILLFLLLNNHSSLDLFLPSLPLPKLSVRSVVQINNSHLWLFFLAWPTWVALHLMSYSLQILCWLSFLIKIDYS